MNTRPPWKRIPLHKWSIVGMNHYHVLGEQRLFVAMVKDGVCIKEEGQDTEELWERLRYKAEQSPHDPTESEGSQ